MLKLLRTHGRYYAVFDVGCACVVHTIGNHDLDATERLLRLLANQATELANHCRHRIDRQATSKLKCRVLHLSTDAWPSKFKCTATAPHAERSFHANKELSYEL